MLTQAKAQSIAKGIRNLMLSWYELRELCDIKTGGELDCFQLDMLTDWVEDCLNYRLNTRFAINASKGTATWDN